MEFNEAWRLYELPGEAKHVRNHGCHIIAEIGSNHNGDFHTAIELIRRAALAGADAVKFQVFTGELWSAKFRDGTVKKMVAKHAIDRDDLPLLCAAAARHGVWFMATPFDAEAVGLLAPLVPAYKIASYELTDHPLLRLVAGTGKPIILSTGMATLGEIHDAIDTISKVRGGRPLDVALLHCTSCYPTPPGQVNLRAMDTLRSEFHLPVGFSDHTLGTEFALAAAARGACIIEKHFTLDPKQEGPDHPFALDPQDFARMVTGVRMIERGLGDGKKGPQECEQGEVRMRRSVHARVDIPKGSMITMDMLCTKRPGYGIAPKDMGLLVGTTAQRDIAQDEWITPADVARRWAKR